MHQWQPYVPQGLFCVAEASCCEEFILCQEGAEFFVRRQAADGTYEETARSPYSRAAKAWKDLAATHRHEARAAS
ncbi:hypothetical protein EDD27_9335 [Nonomuraea polychroma]|uniref:Uncharacterized protein n=1 Tax=Nonomuraea polychroma TaxID=46176 RepID=A0A438ML21_9ACTN|nr:hypothetical protein EDD27_9335 [Nonomuraea polychroma]